VPFDVFRSRTPTTFPIEPLGIHRDVGEVPSAPVPDALDIDARLVFGGDGFDDLVERRRLALGDASPRSRQEGENATAPDRSRGP
jgi:hypothetical protein